MSDLVPCECDHGCAVCAYHGVIPAGWAELREQWRREQKPGAMGTCQRCGKMGVWLFRHVSGPRLCVECYTAREWPALLSRLTRARPRGVKA